MAEAYYHSCAITRSDAWVSSHSYMPEFSHLAPIWWPGTMAWEEGSVINTVLYLLWCSESEAIPSPVLKRLYSAYLEMVGSWGK